MELHIARCDAPGCTTEAPMMVDTSRVDWGIRLPDGWIMGQVVPIVSERLVLCSWPCVAAYAEGRAKEASS